MNFSNFSQILQKLEETSSRLAMTEQLAELYQELNSAEIQSATYLMQGRLVPEYQSLEFNLSTKLIERALAKLLARHQEKLETEAAQQTNLFGDDDFSQLEKVVEKKFKELGDLGQTAEKISRELELHPLDKNENLEKELSILEVFDRLKAIAAFEGEGSQDKKVMALVELWGVLDALSARYVTRIIMGKLRLGFSTMTILDALSWVVREDKSAREILEEAYNKQADVGRLAQAYLGAGDKQERQRIMNNYSVKNGVPLVPALAQRLNSTEEVIEKMGEVIAEPKYDGLRVQLHYKRGESTKAYTRNLDEISKMFPELDSVGKILKGVGSCILDSEVIGYDSETGELLPFQKTVTRRRKHEISSQAKEVPVRFYVFDLMEINGEAFIDVSLRQRKERLSTLFNKNNVFYKTEQIITNEAEVLQQFHQQQLEKGLEGAMFKKVEAPYRGGRKGWRWVKMKEAAGERGQLSDTLDCVVMGYYVGKGKRSKFGIGAVLVGVLDKSEAKIKTITKIGTGLTDVQFKEMKERVDELAAKSKPDQYQVPKDLRPDIWASPGLVIEVAADAITDSPIHKAGVALRFPRLIKFRDDKDWEDATSLEEVKQIR